MLERARRPAMALLSVGAVLAASTACSADGAGSDAVASATAAGRVAPSAHSAPVAAGGTPAAVVVAESSTGDMESAGQSMDRSPSSAALDPTVNGGANATAQRVQAASTPSANAAAQRLQAASATSADSVAQRTPAAIVPKKGADGATIPESSPVVPQASTPMGSGGAGRLGSYPFGPSSAWRTDIQRAPVSTTSPAEISYLVASITDRYGGVAAFNAHKYNSSFYVVPVGTPTVDVKFSNCWGYASVPRGLFGPGGQFTAVPIPAGAVPANGSDGALALYSPHTDQLWEFWKAHRTIDGGWAACWGGRIDSVSTSPGFFEGGFGSTATGLANSGGVISLEEVRRGSIDHAMSLAVPNTAKSRLSWPAQRTDGWDTNPAALAEGSRLRLDPTLDVSKLGLTYVGELVARAAQRYGFIVTDTSGAVAVVAESGASEMAVTQVDPWRSLLQGPDYAVMKNFPWDRLKVIEANYGAP